MSEEASQLPFDIAHLRVIPYGSDIEAAKAVLRRAISVILSSGRLEEAARLFDLSQYRGAIAAGAVVLEQRLREAIAQRPPNKFAQMSLGEMLNVARKRKVVKSPFAERLAQVVSLRNRAVHEIGEPTKEEAQFVLDVIREVVGVLPQHD